MALDRQRILSELGSVMNQLQSADCGCMGKLFNGPGQGQPQGNPLPTCGGCRRGCCPGHGMGMGMRGGAGGDPCPMGMGGGGGGMGCMGRCNAPKLYADTYGYLNQNLMKPVMNEVYSDLKSISPANAVGNSPMAAQLGISPGAGGPMGGQSPGNPMTQNIGNMGNMLDGGGLSGPNSDAMVHGLPASRMGGQPMMDGGQPMMGRGQAMMGGGQPMMGGGQHMMDGGQPMMGEGGNDMGMRNGMGPPSGNPMSGMGSQIMNMMMSSGGGKHRSPNIKGGQLTNQMGANQGQFGASPVGMAYTGQGQGGPDGSDQTGNPGGMAQGFADPQTQFVSGNQVFNANLAANSMTPPSVGDQPGQGMGQAMGPSMGQPMGQPIGQPMGQAMGGDPAGQSMTNQTMGAGGPRITGNVTMPMGGPQTGNTVGGGGQYGQHSAGMKKFAEMFPGVLGGDLGFDPMAIAMQMNPANQKRVATDTMMKLMGGKQGQMQPALTGANAANAQLGQQLPAQQLAPGQQPPVYQQQIPVQQAITGQPVYQQGGQIQPTASMVAQPGQPMYQGQPTPSHQTLAQPGQAAQPIYGQNQQVYSATGAPSMTQQQIPEGQEGYQDSNAQAESNAEQAPPAEGESQPPPPQQMMYIDPIFPAERKIPKSLPSSHKYAAYYNTLGQPVQMVPQSSYKQPEEPSMPVSLSWPESGQHNRTGIKNVMSKTSITGNMALPNSPSRSQLQHYYRQLKGVQGHKPPPVMPPNQLSSSDGKLNPNMPKQQLGIPVEKVGGDTIANNLRNQMLREEPGKVAGGDFKLPNKPHGDVQKEPVQPMPAMGKRVRNGLQDTNYNSKYMSNAWSFHGTYDNPGRPSRITGTVNTPLIGRNNSPSHRAYH